MQFKSEKLRLSQASVYIRRFNPLAIVEQWTVDKRFHFVWAMPDYIEGVKINGGTMTKVRIASNGNLAFTNGKACMMSGTLEGSICFFVQRLPNQVIVN
jgi:hypothetical protein